MGEVRQRRLIHDESIETGPRKDFHWVSSDEPHATRRKEILKSHPDVSKLQGPEWRTKYICLAVVALHIGLARAAPFLSWPVYCVVAYVFGATLTQVHFLAVHELSHNLAFRTPLYNRLLSMVVNLPLVFPMCIMFRQYHLEHHKFQGVDGMDMDLPCEKECRFVKGPVTKLLWASSQIIMYALRPCLVRPVPPSPLVLLNYIVQFAFNALVVKYWGWEPIYFHVLCVLLAGGPHPLAGHFISEHYVFPHLSTTQETYSYYGSLNRIAWNVGYHNEHHDFPYVAWSRLPVLRRVAHKYYDDLAVCHSWTGVIIAYIFRKEIGPYSRVKRKQAVQ